ncbi:P-loop containing nucleoside triphosphate hydrolase protein [Lasiosphaeris hirsuta]|uniref:P-loop containing nucleoside triphosphate hydrolase protein n=1 Tax=Lasiosphaeris hirsuta TaxID=260670 RepID=A0AA40A847_9PEZI|nr:P-loop containing nucleoside triphosphate hydrolase protein [Lasiosphaeris hirsuta]
MSAKPIFVATHPRACSTAFERVFMTRRDILNCIHEPFGDAFYYGPELLSERFVDDKETREKSGFSHVTYKTVVDTLQGEIAKTDKRVFIKDIIYYLFTPNGKPSQAAPSLANTPDDTTSGLPNPTVIPTPILRQFHFTFLIRHPRRAVPSYYRCTVPPLDKVTGFYHFLPPEAGYDELRRLFDFLRSEGIVGPRRAAGSGEAEARERRSESGEGGGVSITVIDADDLLDKPDEVIRAYCAEVGIDYSPAMLRWDDEESQELAVRSFEKWNGFHDDAIGSTSLKPRTHAAKIPTVEEEDEQWRQKFGEEAQKVIRKCVSANIPDYEYLKSFAIKF